MKKYRIVHGDATEIEVELDSMAEQYSPQQVAGIPGWPDGPGTIAVLLRARSEEPDPADDWCIGTDSKGKRCLNDALKDGYCKRHWREAAVRGDVGGTE